jgi:hypothetical protein
MFFDLQLYTGPGKAGKLPQFIKASYPVLYFIASGPCKLCVRLH